jgi:hypothetical protein
MIKSKSNRGGPRANSGRPKGIPKVLIAHRVPVEIAEDIKAYIKSRMEDYSYRAKLLKGN